MNKKSIAVTGLVVFSAVMGWWISKPMDAHKHQPVRMHDEAGAVYWTCAMHPQVRQDEPGNCPICGMNLISKPVKVPSTAGPSGDAAGKPLYWYDPMHPEQHFEQAGKSPFMDMDLVPKYANEVEGSSGSTIVHIDPRMAQNLGMRTAPARSASVAQRVVATGLVAIDEYRVSVVEARAAGWIERLDVRAVGDTVEAGQVLAGIYAPELYAAQQEYALAQKLKDAVLIDAARSRLQLLNAGTRTQRQTAIIAPQSGVITELMVRQGSQISPGMPLMKLADLSQVWVIVEVPEVQAAAVAIGQKAVASLRSAPGQTFSGVVDYVYPQLDSLTRTLRVRLAFDNRDGALKPGMYAEVALSAAANNAEINVPSEAVIRTGTRSVVIVAESEGRFRPVAVTLGTEYTDEIAVLSGLAAGDLVVISGQFLIDSEASLLGAYTRMGSDDSSSSAEHDSHGTQP